VNIHRSRSVICAIAVLCCTGHLWAQAAKPSKQDATRFQAKLVQIEKNAATPRKGNVPRTTQVTDAEVNGYLKYLAGPQIPVGIVEPELHGAGNGRVTGRAIVDLDIVRKSKKRAWTDPMGYLMGRLQVTAAGTLTTKDGVGQFTLESAQVSGVTVPKSLIQELLTYYSTTKENPDGINMDKPFVLPSAIREIKIGQGTATIVQ
jgi:hypothetical protein